MTADERDLAAEARSPDGMTLGDLAREIPGGASIEGDASIRCFGVHHDSRRVTRGDLFVVRRGERYDGRAFVASAIDHGAAAILVERGDLADLGDLTRGATPTAALPNSGNATDPITSGALPSGALPSGATSSGAIPVRGSAADAIYKSVPTIVVDDAKIGLAYAAAAIYGHPAFSLDVVGVTGTNGKTTTTHLVRAAIDGAAGVPCCGMVGTLGHTYAGRTIAAAHTTPEADELARVLAVMRKRGATSVAMEVSSIALVAKRVAAVRFRVAAFTNLTQDHLDFHGSMEAYAAAKMELFTSAEPGLAVINVDDPFGAKIASAVRCKAIRVRTRVGAADGDVAPIKVDATTSGMRIVARVPTGMVDFRSRLVGLHNLENLLVALGIVSALELDVERAAAALEEEVGAPGRLERCDSDGDDVVVLVDYAHTPDALARVLDAVGAVASTEARILCVFGCGGDRDPSKRAPMGNAAGARAHVLIVTSDNPRTESPESIARPIEDGVREAGHPRIEAEDVARADRGYIVELDRGRAIELAIRSAKPGDVVLLAGKGHEDYQIVGTTKRPFDDRVEARAALAKRRARSVAEQR